MVELAMSALQLGHARPRVETESFAGRTEQTSSCFNWATRVRAWKPVTLWCASSIVMSFNWATRVRAWKRQSGILCRNPYARFNWATRVRAWKRHIEDDGRIHPDLLQLGHARPRVETAPELTPSPPAVACAFASTNLLYPSTRSLTPESATLGSS